MDDLSLLRAYAQKPGLRIAWVGIGNELNGDDAAGMLAARALQEVFDQRTLAGDDVHGRRMLVLATGPAPESFTGPIRRFAPHLVVLLDAAELGQAPGTIRVFDWASAVGMSASTHTLPPSMLARFLIAELGCDVLLVGIQPRQLEMDAGVSAQVQQATERLVLEIQNILDLPHAVDTE